MASSCCGLEYLKLDPEDEAEDKKKDMPLKDLFNIFKLTFPYLWPKNETGLKVRLVLSVSMIFVTKGIGLLVPLTIAMAINDLSLDAPMSPVKWILLYGALKVIMSVLKEVQETVFLNVTQNAALLISTRCFAHLHNLSLAYHLKRKSGAVLRSIKRGASSLSQLIRITLFTLFPALVEFFMTLFLLGFAYGWAFAANLFAAIALYVILTFLLSNWRRKFRRVSNKYDNKAGEIAFDSLLNFETVKTFTTEQVEVERYKKSISQFLSVELASRFSLMILNSSQQITITAGLVGGLWIAASKIVAGDGLEVGDLVAVQFYLLQVVAPLSWLGSAWEFINSASMDVESLMEIMDEPIDVTDVLGAEELELSPGRNSIKFSNVSFGYGPDRKILNNVSFEVKSGETLAIVGPTGSGKSTIGRLLLRYYDIDSGTIEIGGQSSRSVTMKSLRSNIAVVSQDTVLFNETIGFNIEYGGVAKGPVSQSEIEQVARRAQIADFINNSPEGYETMVGERGLRLSGGEKQRIGIARALLKKSNIWLLDEATSALDTRTETAITETLNEASSSHTTIIIAHRLSTVMNADEICVLDQGVIVERGTHHSLLEQQGAYYGLWMAQVTAEKGEKGKEESASPLIEGL